MKREPFPNVAERKSKVHPEHRTGAAVGGTVAAVRAAKSVSPVAPGGKRVAPRFLVFTIYSAMWSSLLYDFAPPSPDSPTDWRTINDTVMGGVSESVFVATKEGAGFTGTVSLQKGGGFASVRSPEQTRNLGDANGLSLRLRRDGKRYWFTTYTVPGGPISYRSPLRPPAHWTTMLVSFADLTPYRRGAEVPDAPPFAASQLQSVGFLIADKQNGAFQLEIARIEAATTESHL